MRNARSILARLSFTRVAWEQATRVRTIMAGVGASLLLLGGVWSAAQAQEVTSHLTVAVPVQAFVFQPTTVSVPVGTTVVWTNLDPVDHTVTDVDQYWDSGLFGEGGVFTKTFDTPGTYVYYCIPHPIMIGTIEVTE
jgi:plastocyanin